MTRTLHTAGVPNETLSFIPDIVDTCRVCRVWSAPKPDSYSSVRLILAFNDEVEGDLIFYTSLFPAARPDDRKFIVLLLVCRGVRWAATSIVANKAEETILTAIELCWLNIFGPMKTLIFDGEICMDTDAVTAWCEQRGITKKTRAPGQHV